MQLGNRTIHIVALFLLGAVQAFAQPQIQTDQTEFSSPFRARLAQSKKFDAQPLLPTLDTLSSQNQTYVVPTHLLQLAYPAPIIRPLAMPRAKANEVYNLYVKAGFGYPLSPLAEVSYYNNDIERLKYGVGVRHHSLLQGNLPNQTFTQTGLDLGATYFTEKNFAVGGALDVDFNTNRYYGFDPDLQGYQLSEDSMQQRFLNLGINAHLFNGKMTKQRINYRVDLDFYRYSDAFGSVEYKVQPNLVLEKWLGKGKYSQLLRLETGVSFVSFSDVPVRVRNDQTTSAKNLFLFYFHPTAHLNFGDFKTRLGANLGVNEGQFYIQPDVELSYSIANGGFVPYIGAVGEVRQNTFRSFTRYNRFLVSNPELHHTNYLEFFGGLRGSVKKTTYDIRGGYAMTPNLPYFINDTIGGMGAFYRFRPVYDTAGIIFVRGTVDFRLLKNLVIGGTAGYQIYQPTNWDKAFHLPTFESNFFVEYVFRFKNTKKKADKDSNYLTVRGELYINAGIPYLDENQKIEVLAGLYDFNLHVQYQLSSKVALFADLNNLINNRNQRWYLYPQLGFNGMVGVEMRF